MDLHLRGKRVLITGASRGAGAAEVFAEEGGQLLLAARSGPAGQRRPLRRDGALCAVFDAARAAVRDGCA